MALANDKYIQVYGEALCSASEVKYIYLPIRHFGKISLCIHGIREAADPAIGSLGGQSVATTSAEVEVAPDYWVASADFGIDPQTVTGNEPVKAVVHSTHFFTGNPVRIKLEASGVVPFPVHVFLKVIYER